MSRRGKGDKSEEGKSLVKEGRTEGGTVQMMPWKDNK